MEYTQIIEKEGKTYLFDGNSYGRRSLQTAKVSKAYNEAFTLLQRYDYPSLPDWVEAVMAGSVALKKIIIQDTEDNARRVGVPRHVAEIWCRSAVEAIPAEMLAAADEIRRAFDLAVEGLPINPEDITFGTEAPFVDEIAIKGRLEVQFMTEVTEDEKASAKELADVVNRVRSLEDKGINAIQLVKDLAGSYLAPSKRPELSPFVLYSAVMTNRHNDRETVKRNNLAAYYMMGGE